MLPTLQRLTLAALGLTVFAVACGPDGDGPLDNTPPPPREISSTEALTIANQNLRAGLVGGAQSARGVTDSDLLNDLFDRATGAAPCADPNGCAPSPDPELEGQASALADRLALLIFNAGNIERTEATRTVLRLVPEVVCADTSTNAGAIADDCRTAYSNTAVRLELSSRRAGEVDVAISVDDLTIGTVGLHAQELTVELDLGAAVVAYNNLLAKGGAEGEAFAGTLTGRVRAKLALTGAQQAEVSLAILSGVEVDTTIEDQRYHLSLNPADPVLAVALDGAAPSVTVRSNQAGGKVRVPLAALASGSRVCSIGPDGVEHCETTQSNVTGDLEVHLPSSRGSLTLSAGDRIQGELTLGGALVALAQGRTIVNIDLNATRGRGVAFTLQPSAEVMIFELARSLSVVAELNFGTLSEALQLPDTLVNETFTLDVDGAPNAILELNLGGTDVVSPGGEPTPSRSILKMVVGQLRFAARTAGTSIQVIAGQCLNSVEPTPDQPSSALGLEGGVCR